MKKNYEEPIFNIARFTLKDALLAPSGGGGESEGSIGTDGNSSGSEDDKDMGGILG